MTVPPAVRRLTPFIALALLVSGCRFGTTPENPFGEFPSTAEAAGGAAGSGEPGGNTDTGGSGFGSGGSADVSSGGASGAAEAGGAGTGSGGEPALSFDAGSFDPQGSCDPASAPLVCDPVKNLGCLVPFSQCDVDPTQAVAAGRCVFPFVSTPLPPDAGAACQVNATTETCLPTSTCVNGTCRKLCYCDADCGASGCCRAPAPGVSSAFALCGPC